MLVFIDSETGKPFEGCYQQYLEQIYHTHASNPKTEGEIVCTFEPREELVTDSELQGLTIGQRLEVLKRKQGAWEN